MTAVPYSSTRVSKAAASTDTRQLEDTIAALFSQAQQAAEGGDIGGSARFILKALDGERRLAARGPQVLQLIKPRG